MDLLEQCRIWNENDEYQEIIDAIEAIPESELTPELASELARAYNNAADVEDKEYFEKSVSLLNPYEEYFEGDHCWNFRIAYAYYYLDQEGLALHYFENALEARPGDEDTMEMIKACRSCLACPHFDKSFRERTEEAWAAFVKEEAELRSLMDQKDQEQGGNRILKKCGDILHLAFKDIAFELGFNGTKYELILTPEGDRARLFELVYFRRHVPEPVLEYWNIWVGRQPGHGFGLHRDGWEVSDDEVQVWAEKKDEQNVSLALYCEKLLPLLKEKEEMAWWMLYTLTDQVLGEIPAIAHIYGFEVLKEPKEEQSIILTDLPREMENMGITVYKDADSYLENCYSAYELEPSDDPESDWRLDVFAGATRCIPLLNEYLNNESSVMDAFHKDGAVPGFFCYPTDDFTGEERAKNMLDFRDALEEAVLEKAGEDAVTFLGGASGLYCGYLDFIAWDLPAVMDAAREFFEAGPTAWGNFHTFRRNVSAVRLYYREEAEAETEE